MRLFYNYLKALLAPLLYGFPAKKLKIIGITGTKGKTTTANFIWTVLNNNGHKCGLVGTANIRIGDNERLNKYHMTMPGHFILQKLLKEMVDAKCEYVVLEVTSEGIKRFRHFGLKFNTAIFTNLTPEHLPSHNNSFENYKSTKAKLFKTCPNLIIANVDDSHASYYLNNQCGQKITFSIKNQSDYQAKIIDFSNFELNNFKYSLNILGKINIYNAIPAIILGEKLGISPKNIQKSFDKLVSIPGRMEFIPNKLGLQIIVDYAHEPVSLKELLQTAQDFTPKNNKIILLLGAEGGGRDPAKRAPMGDLANKYADFAIVTNVDPYQDDPQIIANDIAVRIDKNKLYLILDRQEAVKKAVSLGQKGDTILITGKGAEQSITIDGQKIPWDDRKVVKMVLNSV